MKNLFLRKMCWRYLPIAMLVNQRTKSASKSGQQSDTASTATATSIAIARITIARERERFSPQETLLLLPFMIITSGLSAFFTLFTSLLLLAPSKIAKRLPNPLITKEIRSPISLFHTSTNSTSQGVSHFEQYYRAMCRQTVQCNSWLRSILSNIGGHIQRESYQRNALIFLIWCRPHFCEPNGRI